MVAYFTSHATKKELLLLMLFSSLSTTTAVVCNRKTTRKEVDKKLKNFVPRVGMCLAVLIIKFQHKIGTHKIHFYPQAKTWRNVANFTFWVTKMVNLANFEKHFALFPHNVIWSRAFRKNISVLFFYWMMICWYCISYFPSRISQFKWAKTRIKAALLPQTNAFIQHRHANHR